MNPELLKAVVDVNAVAESLGIKVVLVGALVLEFTTEIKPDYPQPKRTSDADFAIFVDSWESFDEFRAALEAKHYKRSPKVEHRFANEARTILIDLIPVGGGITKDGKVVCAFFGPNPPPSRSITRQPVGAYPASVSEQCPPPFRG